MFIRTQYPDLFLTTMLPALDELIFNRYDRFPPQFSRVFRVMDSKRSIEQTSEIAGLGTFNKINEGGNMRYDNSVPGFSKTYTHSQYGLGFKMSRIMVDDDRWGIINKMSSELGRSARESIEIEAASDFNNGFSGSYLGPDGKSLFATDHPLVKGGGTQQNTLSVAADLDIASLEIAVTDMRRMKDPSGKKIRLRPELLIVPPELNFVAAEIMTATKRSDTANNTPNAFKVDSGFGTLDQYLVWDYLNDTDAWFLRAAQEDTELRFYWREKPNTLHDVDFDSRSVKTAMWYRMSHGWSSFYGVYGSPGA
jgi:phage major head subunit gpT-like protein